MSWFKDEYEEVHKCPFCGRECYGEICERCRERLGFEE